MANDIIVSEMTSASQINTNDLMIMTQPDLLAETGYSTKKGTVLQVANKMLKGTEYLTDLPDFTDKTVLGGLEELKGDLTALLPVNTASGAIANFDTDLTLPLVDCKANIVATGGNGTPDNPVPINGYSSANITRCGSNLWDEEWELGSFDATGNLTPNNNAIRSSNFTPIVGGASFYFACNVSAVTNLLIYYYDEDQTFISRDVGTASRVVTTPANCRYFKIRLDNINTYSSGVAVNYPSTDTTYHAYNGQTYAIAFGQTVYGGVLDVTRGKLTVTHLRKTSFTRGALDTSGKLYKIADLTDGSEWLDTYNAPPLKCNMFVIVGLGEARTLNSGQLTQYGKVVYISGYVGNETALDALLPNLEVVYPLATPIDIDLTPTQINALVGVNNVYNDTNGDTEVKYKEGIQHYIDKKIAETQALIL